MTATVTKFPSSGTEVSDGDAAWDEPENAKADDDSVVTTTLGDGDESHSLRMTEFFFALTGTVVKVQVAIYVEDVNGSASFKHVYLVNDGTRFGDEMSGGAALSGGQEFVFEQDISFPASEANNSNFGVDVAVESSGGAAEVQIDYIKMTLTAES